LNYVYRKSPKVSTVRVGEEAVLMSASRQPLEPGRCYRLNDVGAFVWERIDGRRTVSEIANAVCREFSVELLQIRSDLDRFFYQLVEIGAVSVQQPNDGPVNRPAVH
jgi:hypothetical protein